MKRDYSTTMHSYIAVHRGELKNVQSSECKVYGPTSLPEAVLAGDSLAGSSRPPTHPPTHQWKGAHRSIVQGSFLYVI
jgi:hypothetical protein